MTPKFAQAVDPIFLYALALLDRIGRGEDPAPRDEQLKIRALIDEAEASLGTGPEWELAKYGLVTWIDEMLVDALWTGREWWNNNVLEVDLFGGRAAAERFFIDAKKCSQQSGRNALEVYYVCVILGFRGLYHDPLMAADVAAALDLPRELEEWTRQTALSIRLGQGRPPLADAGREVHGAPPLSPRSIVIWPWLLATLLAAFATVYGYHTLAS